MINSINFTYLIKRRKITVNLNRIEKIKKKKIVPHKPIQNRPVRLQQMSASFHFVFVISTAYKRKGGNG